MLIFSWEKKKIKKSLYNKRIMDSPAFYSTQDPEPMTF